MNKTDTAVCVGILHDRETRMTENEFVSRVKDQNKKLYLSALSVVKNAADAEDAVASAVAYAWEKLADLRDENNKGRMQFIIKAE